MADSSDKLNKFNQLRIDDTLYTVNDTTKVVKPEVNGEENDILVNAIAGEDTKTLWKTIKTENGISILQGDSTVTIYNTNAVLLKDELVVSTGIQKATISGDVDPLENPRTDVRLKVTDEVLLKSELDGQNLIFTVKDGEQDKDGDQRTKISIKPSDAILLKSEITSKDITIKSITGTPDNDGMERTALLLTVNDKIPYKDEFIGKNIVITVKNNDSVRSTVEIKPDNPILLKSELQAANLVITEIAGDADSDGMARTALKVKPDDTILLKSELLGQNIVITAKEGTADSDGMPRTNREIKPANAIPLKSEFTAKNLVITEKQGTPDLDGMPRTDLQFKPDDTILLKSELRGQNLIITTKEGTPDSDGMPRTDREIKPANAIPLKSEFKAQNLVITEKPGTADSDGMPRTNLEVKPDDTILLKGELQSDDLLILSKKGTPDLDDMPRTNLKLKLSDNVLLKDELHGRDIDIITKSKAPDSDGVVRNDLYLYPGAKVLLADELSAAVGLTTKAYPYTKSTENGVQNRNKYNIRATDTMLFKSELSTSSGIRIKRKNYNYALSVNGSTESVPRTKLELKLSNDILKRDNIHFNQDDFKIENKTTGTDEDGDPVYGVYSVELHKDIINRTDILTEHGIKVESTGNDHGIKISNDNTVLLKDELDIGEGLLQKSTNAEGRSTIELKVDRESVLFIDAIEDSDDIEAEITEGGGLSFKPTSNIPHTWDIPTFSAGEGIILEDGITPVPDASGDLKEAPSLTVSVDDTIARKNNLPKIESGDDFILITAAPDGEEDYTYTQYTASLITDNIVLVDDIKFTTDDYVNIDGDAKNGFTVTVNIDAITQRVVAKILSDYSTTCD